MDNRPKQGDRQTGYYSKSKMKTENSIELKIGMRVHYTTGHGTKENGIVKSINEGRTIAFVVYNCNNEWDRYYDYTGAATNIEDLTEGWINIKTNFI